MDAPKKIGPSGYGGTDGAAQDITAGSVPQVLQKITVWFKSGSAGRINAISFIYTDQDDQAITLGPWGTAEGESKEVSIAQGDEYLTELSGTTDKNRVTSLTFFTSKPAKHGPYGKNPTPNDIPFIINVNPDSIVAFFGRSDHYLTAIGAYSGPQA